MSDLLSRAVSQIQRVTTAPLATEQLATYFEPAKSVEHLGFSGRWFERLDGGGDRAEVADRITAADLVAVTTLSVEVPAEIALRLLEGELGQDLAKLIERVPVDLRLQDAEEADVAEGSPADEAWRLLVAQPGVNWVIAGKLLARKRPHLIPVYDNVVRCALGKPEGRVWEGFRRELRREGGALAQRLAVLRSEAGLPESVSLLRVLDVLVWRDHRDDHRAGRCGH